MRDYNRYKIFSLYGILRLLTFIVLFSCRLNTTDAALSFKPKGKAVISRVSLTHLSSSTHLTQVRDNHKNQSWDYLICKIPRGGAEEDLENDSPVVIVLLHKLGHILGQTIQAFSRAVQAGISSTMETDEIDDDSKNKPLVRRNPIGKIVKVLVDMARAAFDTDSFNSHQSDDASTSNTFARKLCKLYGISWKHDDDDDNDNTNDNTNDHHIVIQNGSLSQALQKARSNAQLLVVYIPSPSKPNKSKTSNDYKALKSLVSKEVYNVANKPSIAKSPSYNSFAFWATSKHDAKEAILAKKQLKIKTNPSSKKKHHPILLVVYPSLAIDKYGTSKITPRVLAQHHCNPPPSETNMASWLNALRKRHKKQYANMQYEIKEMELFQERTKGYKKSILEDSTREQREKEEEERKEQLEKERREKELALQERRKELLANLPEEPSSASRKDNVVTIALRFTNGKKGQRRFLDTVKMEQLFNWVDAEFELERESVILTTMNGSKSFDYDSVMEEGVLIKDSGLGKMAALRVTVKVEDEEGENKSDDEGDEDESHYDSEEDQ